MVSVIIPSFNSETTIGECLNALKTQTYKGAYEIILVDSSNDQTPEIVRKKFADIKYFHFDKQTDPGTARNYGLMHSSGDPILFIDSDCEAQADWIERMVRLHETTEYAAIGGAVLNGNHTDSNVAWAGYLAEFREFLPEHPAREVDHIPTCNISYKRPVLENLNGFHPKYYPQEDLELNYRLKKMNRKIWFDSAIRIRHHHRLTLRSFFKHQKKVGQITSTMLQILPLSGATIARSKLLTTLAIPFLPVIKWLKTFSLFLKYQPTTMFHHPVAVFIFSLGLIPWSIGFLSGVYFQSEITKERSE